MRNKDEQHDQTKTAVPLRNRTWLNCEFDKNDFPIKKSSGLLKTLGFFSIAAIAIATGTAIYKEMKTWDKGF